MKKDMVWDALVGLCDKQQQTSDFCGYFKFYSAIVYGVRKVGRLLLIACVFLGCSKTGLDPSSTVYSIQGTLTVAGEANPDSALVRLWAAPQDIQLQQALSQYPALGFAPVSPMLFNPLTLTPLRSGTPASDGSFRFDDLPAGSYFLDAALAGYDCPDPLFFTLPGGSNVGPLTLAEAQPVNGTLNSAVWESGEVYRITGDVLVPPGQTLTIQSGVLILLAGDYTFTVSGRILIDGIPAHPVRFRLTPEHHALGGDWGGLRLNETISACEITGVQFQGAATALRAIGGTAHVEECLFEAPAAFGAYFSAAAEGWVKHSIVRDGNQGLVADNSSPQIEYNLLLRMSGRAITVKTNSQATLYSNAMYDCQTGIWSDWNTTPLIHYNLISGGSRALEAQDGFTALVEYNEFIGQSVECIYLNIRNCYPTIRNNNFIAIPPTVLRINGNNGQQADTVYAQYNYWNGEDLSGIPALIIDGQDVGSPGNPISPVVFQPFRLTPVAGTGP
jgi:hypothetical protein